MKLLSSIISASHFFENAYALTDFEVSAFGCREGVYYQYEKVASNGGIAINQRASGMFFILGFAYFCSFKTKTTGMGVTTIINCLATETSKNVK